MVNARADLLRLIGNIERDLEENPDPRLVQLQALRAALLAFGSPVRASANSVPKSGRHKTGAKMDYFRSIVGELIDREGGSVHRSEILKQLSALNFFSGHNPERAMSKYLTTAGIFAPAGDGMWKRKPAPEVTH